MKLDHIALDRLSISPVNMRSGKKPPDISGILPSIRARGIIMPLLVRPNGSDTTFEIVAGSRRFLAAQTVATESGNADPKTGTASSIVERTSGSNDGETK